MNLARSSHWQAVGLLAFCALLWSTAGVFTRQLHHPEGFEVTFWRSVFCVLAMVFLIWHKTRSNPAKAVQVMGLTGLFSGLMWAIMFVCFMVALTRTSTANTLLVSSISPLLAALLGWLVLGHKIKPTTWLAIGLAFVGIWWMVRGALSTDGLDGMLIALGVPIAAALNIVVVKKVGARVDLAPAVLIGGVLSALITLPLAWPLESGGHDLIILALLGFLQLALPCFLMLRAVPFLAAHEIALITMLEVLLGPIWAWLWAGETISSATWQGGLAVLAALLINEFLSRTAIDQAEA
jgi:drug/metabolite transporter (DMT)-like permease